MLADCLLLLLLLFSILFCHLVSYVRASRYTNVQVLLIIVLLLYNRMPVGCCTNKCQWVTTAPSSRPKKGNGKEVKAMPNDTSGNV